MLEFLTGYQGLSFFIFSTIYIYICIVENLINEIYIGNAFSIEILPLTNDWLIIFQILGSPLWRQSLGVDAVLLLTLLVQYRKHEVSKCVPIEGTVKIFYVITKGSALKSNVHLPFLVLKQTLFRKGCGVEKRKKEAVKIIHKKKGKYTKVICSP